MYLDLKMWRDERILGIYMSAPHRPPGVRCCDSDAPKDSRSVCGGLAATVVLVQTSGDAGRRAFGADLQIQGL